MTIVTHTTGRLELDGTDLVSTMAGTRGLIRKQPWQKTDRWPLAQIAAVQVQTEGDRVDLAVVPLAGLAVRYGRCEPTEAIEELLEAIVEASPNVRVNDIDMAAERERALAEARARGEEIVGVDHRVTVTRLVLGGVVGGLLFKKRQVIRRRDL